MVRLVITLRGEDEEVVFTTTVDVMEEEAHKIQSALLNLFAGRVQTLDVRVQK